MWESPCDGACADKVATAARVDAMPWDSYDPYFLVVADGGVGKKTASCQEQWMEMESSKVCDDRGEGGYDSSVLLVTGAAQRGICL